MSELWKVWQKKADFKAIASKYNIDQVTARVLRNREVISDEEIELFLNGSMEVLHAPSLMQNMEGAARFLLEAIDNKKNIRIIGDYDVDGVTSSSILFKGLTALGAKVSVTIPDRMLDGYGLNERLIYSAKEDGIDIILTCDNGIAASKEIALANELSMEVVVTDHHEVPFEEIDGVKSYKLPAARYIVDPKQETDNYPFKEICGAVVAYKLITCMFSVKEVKDTSLLEELLELAALGTVCDVMPLFNENRIIVKEGLKRLSNPKNTGLGALIKVTGIVGKELSPYHLGFIIGPCINATGRIDSAMKAYSLLVSEDMGEAVEIATQLKNLNESRKSLTEAAVKQAKALVEEEIKTTGLSKVIVLYLKDCHESLAGIVAGRIKEAYNRPCFVLTNAEGEEGLLKGSGRSIENYNMYESMTEVSELFTKFGGHKLAAGFSLKEKNHEELKRQLNEKVTLNEEDFVRVVHIDAAMPIDYISDSLMRDFAKLSPYGTGNPQPLFAQKDVVVRGIKLQGKTNNVVKLTLLDCQNKSYEAVYFADAAKLMQDLRNKYGEVAIDALLDGEYGTSDNVAYSDNKAQVCLTIAYVPEYNTFRGRTTLQLQIKNYRV